MPESRWWSRRAARGAGEPIVEKQVVYPIVEDLVLEWRPREGMPVDYENVLQVLLELHRHFRIFQFSFDRFNSVQLIQSLQSKGANAQDLAFTNPQQMAMYKNLRQVIYAGLISLLDQERTNYQTKRVRTIDSKSKIPTKSGKIEPPEGEHKDLADARAAAVYFAAKYSGIAHEQLLRQ